MRRLGLLGGVSAAALLAPQDAEAAAIVLGFVGQAIGGMIGGSILGISAAAIGGYIGSTIGSYVDAAIFGQTLEGPRLSDLTVTASTYGGAIALAWGPNVRIAGNIIWSPGLIEVSKKKKHGGKGAPGVTTREYTYHTHLAVALCEGQASALKRIWANGKLIFEDNGTGEDVEEEDILVPPLGGLLGTDFPTVFWQRKDKATAKMAAVRFYPGSYTQEPDPLIESLEGVGEVPGYRGTCYVVIERLELADFGNRIPNLEFEIEAQAAISVRGVVEDICARAGVSEVYARPMAEEPVDGYAVGRPATAWAAIQPLASAYAFDVADRGGVMMLVPRGRPPVATIPPGDLAATGMSGDGGTERNAPVMAERAEDRSLPRAAALTYRDIALDYQTNTQSVSRDLGDSQNDIAAEISLNLTATKAARIVDRMLHEAWSSRVTVPVRLTDRWINLGAADTVALPITRDRLELMRVERVTRGKNGVIEVDLRSDDPEVYRSTAVGQQGILPPNPLALPGDTQLVLIDAPILLDGNDNAGFYWAAGGTDTGWRGAEILRSIDGGGTFDQMATAGVPADIGAMAAPLPAGPSYCWDRANSFTVTMLPNSELESASEYQVLAGANVAWIGPASGQGGEYVQFTTATLVAPLTYEISGLLRGRRGTEHAIGTHGPGEVFVLMLGGTVGRSDYGVGDWNRERTYRAVSVYQDVDEADDQLFSNSGEGLRPPAPVHPRGVRSGDDIALSWVRRTRLLTPGLGGGPVPLGEEAEAWEVDILSGASVVRTIASAAPAAAYSAAEQTVDGLTPGDPVSGNIYQVSGARGRGHPLAFTV